MPTVDLKVIIEGKEYSVGVETKEEHIEHAIVMVARNLICTLRNRNKDKKEIDTLFTKIELDHL